MPDQSANRFQLSRFRMQWCVVAILGLTLLSQIRAQEMRGLAVQGYVTSLHLPDGFEVNGQQHVALRPDTGYGLQKDRVTVTDSPLRNALQVGAFVFVLGEFNGHTHTASAQTVLFRDDWDRKYSGLGVIDKVISTEAEPVFRADGFPIRIAAATQTSFHGDVKSLADVGPGTWLHYEGKRDAQGVVIATKARFMRVRAKRAKPVSGIEAFSTEFEPPDLATHKNGRMKVALIGGWHTVPADPLLQDRVARVGMTVIPAWQRELADDQPFKIPFFFYVVDDDRVRSEYISSKGGLIGVPRAIVERLNDDSELAAVLADGVAFTIQQQGTRILMEQRVALGMEAASLALVAFSPAVALDLAVNGAMPNTKEQIQMEEQRGRIALALLADAGYDPWQAPEAWRLLDPKHPPADPAALKYPSRSGYQLGILNLQYKKADQAPASATNAPAAQ